MRNTKLTCHKNSIIITCTITFGLTGKFDLNIDVTHNAESRMNNIQLSPEGEVNSGGYIPRREANQMDKKMLL